MDNKGFVPQRESSLFETMFYRATLLAQYLGAKIATARTGHYFQQQPEKENTEFENAGLRVSFLIR